MNVRQVFCIENYLNNPKETPEDKVLTELFREKTGCVEPALVYRSGRHSIEAIANKRCLLTQRYFQKRKLRRGRQHRPYVFQSGVASLTPRMHIDKDNEMATSGRRKLAQAANGVSVYREEVVTRIQKRETSLKSAQLRRARLIPIATRCIF